MTAQASTAGPATRRGPNPWMLGGGLLVVLPLLLLLAVSFGRNPRAVPFMLQDKPAPTFALYDLDGQQVSLDELQGRPVVINFWATWCQPCKIEHPVLLESAQRWPDVAFLGVIYADRPDRARSYLARAGSNYPSLIDPDGRMAVDYGVGGVPETYFITRDGIIAYKHTGPVTRELMSRLIGPLLEGG